MAGENKLLIEKGVVLNDETTQILERDEE